MLLSRSSSSFTESVTSGRLEMLTEDVEDDVEKCQLRRSGSISKKEISKPRNFVHLAGITTNRSANVNLSLSAMLGFYIRDCHHKIH